MNEKKQIVSKGCPKWRFTSILLLHVIFIVNDCFTATEERVFVIKIYFKNVESFQDVNREFRTKFEYETRYEANCWEIKENWIKSI